MATEETQKADKSEKKQIKPHLFQPGKSGNPNGRPKGSKSAKTKLIESKLEELDCDPIEGMVKIALDKEVPAAVRGKMFAELAGFVYPKRKAVEHSGNLGNRESGDYTEEELQAMLDANRDN